MSVLILVSCVRLLFVPRGNVVAPSGGSFVKVVWKIGTSPHFIADGAEKLRNATEGPGD